MFAKSGPHLGFLRTLVAGVSPPPPPAAAALVLPDLSKSRRLWDAAACFMVTM
jgi:hypothetical protein